MLEEWDRNAVFTLRGQRIAIVPSPTEMLLCVGRLPISYSDQQFHNLVSIYGEVRRYFLMISEKTGKKMNTMIRVFQKVVLPYNGNVLNLSFSNSHPQEKARVTALLSTSQKRQRSRPKMD